MTPLACPWWPECSRCTRDNPDGTSASAILNRILISILVERFPSEVPIAGGQPQVRAVHRPEAGDLPTADELVQNAVGVAPQRFAVSERQLGAGNDRVGLVAHRAPDT